jgi:hypothetical protein
VGDRLVSRHAVRSHQAARDAADSKSKAPRNPRSDTYADACARWVTRGELRQKIATAEAAKLEAEQALAKVQMELKNERAATAIVAQDL